MKKDNPLVSIIIPAFNEEKNIAACLETILNQTYKKVEVIVIDDGSTDKTPEIIKTFPVLFFKQSHLGPANARNLGVGHAKGEILVFVDSDMTFSKSFIEELVNPIRTGEYKGTFSKEEYISNWNNPWARCWNYNQDWPFKKMIPDDYPDEGKDFRAILKKEFLKVKGYDSVGYTDTWTLAKKLGYKPHSVKGAKYFHANPDTLGECFMQAKWVAKREYKLGVFGEVFTLVKSSFFVSLIIGISKSFRYKEPKFLLFKIVYDVAIFAGIWEMITVGKLSK